MCNSPIRKWSRRRPARISRGRLSFYVEPGRDRWHSRVWEVAAIINHSSPKQRQKNRQPAWRGRPTNTNSQDAPRRRRKHWHAVRTVPAPKNSRSYSSYAERVRHRERKRDRKGEKKKKKKKKKRKIQRVACTCEGKKKRKKEEHRTMTPAIRAPLAFSSLVFDGSASQKDPRTTMYFFQWNKFFLYRHFRLASENSSLSRWRDFRHVSLTLADRRRHRVPFIVKSTRREWRFIL